VKLGLRTVAIGLAITTVRCDDSSRTDTVQLKKNVISFDTAEDSVEHCSFARYRPWV